MKKVGATLHVKPKLYDPVTLELDTENPRFAGLDAGGKLDEPKIIRHLMDSADLPELLESIATNGYVDIEPVVAIKNGKLRVIEGNRRVAALKLLRDPKLAEKCKVTLPTIEPDAVESLKEISVFQVQNREAARQFIGFKHINGPHKWDSYAKGKYAADWYRADKDKGISVSDIAKSLGDRHDTVHRLIQGIFALEQAKKNGLFDPADRFDKDAPFYFSHFYTALARPEYRQHLGMSLEWRKEEPSYEPIPVASYDKFKQLLRWIYGSAADAKVPVVRKQNPHVKQLGEVLENPRALTKLKATDELSKAYSDVETRERKFETSLVRAVTYAEDAQKLVDAFSGEPALLEYAQVLSKIASNIERAVTTAAKKADEREEK